MSVSSRQEKVWQKYLLGVNIVDFLARPDLRQNVTHVTVQKRLDK